MGDFRKLAVWQKAHAVTLAMYHETARWPKHELFGLVSQARRAAVSISANIAEGCGKNSDAELARHCRTSLGSASELSYYVTLTHELGYLTEQTCDDLQASISEVRRMLASLERLSAAAAERAAPSFKLRRKSPPSTDAVPADG
jgi:four helix bundle protein